MERPELEKILVLLQEFRTAKEDAHTYFIQAFECLVYAYTKLVFAICRLRRVPEADQKDVAQEVFISISRSLSGFQGDSAAGLHGWIQTIINHRITDYFRKYPKLEQLNEILALSSPHTSELESRIMAKSEGERAMLALTRLPQQDQTLIRLELLDKLSPREVAAILGIENLKTLRTRRKRAMDRWRQEKERLEREGGKNVC